MNVRKKGDDLNEKDFKTDKEKNKRSSKTILILLGHRCYRANVGRGIEKMG